MTDDSRPYAAAAWTYIRAGWAGAVPIGWDRETRQWHQRRKAAPPAGFTGWAGVNPSGADVQAWIDGPEGACNIGLHLHADVYVLDVDAHNRKPAAEALARLVSQCGPLPATWTSTARGADAASRHHFFRAKLPEGRVWVDHPESTPEALSGLDALHTGHRYPVVWPSVHPDGAEYLWYDPTGEVYEGAPDPGWLVDLPEAWMLALSKLGEPLEGSAAGTAQAFDVINHFRRGEPCPPVARLLADELNRITAARDGGALHHPGPLYALSAYGIEGHVGLRGALSRHQEAYTEARVRLRGEATGPASADWWRMVCGAIGKKLTATGGAIAERCDCDDAIDATGDAIDATPRAHLRDQLLRRSQFHTIAPPRHLIRDTLDLESETWLIGSPGSFKSFVALDWACRVATGASWARRDVRKGPVLYVAAEGARGILQRIKAWELHNEIPVGDEFVLLPQAVYGVQKARDGVGQHPLWGQLRELARELEPSLVVLDTQARMTIGLEENSNSDMSAWVEAVAALKRDTGACVLVVHHVGRNGKDARGASSIDGAQDMEWKVTRTGAKEALTAALRMEKNKDGRDDIEWTLTMRLVPVGIDEEGRTVTSLAADVTRAGSVRVELEHERTPTQAQAEVLYVFRHFTHQDGETPAGILRKVNEIRKERAEKGGYTIKPMTSGVLYKALSTKEGFGGLLEKGFVTRPTSSRWAFREDAPDARDLGEDD